MFNKSQLLELLKNETIDFSLYVKLTKNYYKNDSIDLFIDTDFENILGE